MSIRSSRTHGESSASVHQQLPFTNDAADQEDFGPRASSIRSADRPSSRFLRSQTSVSGLHLSSSYGHKTPARSFFHHASQGGLDPHYSSQGVREQTQELASWALGSDPDTARSVTSHSNIHVGHGNDNASRPHVGSVFSEQEPTEPRTSADSSRPEIIEEVSEPVSPENENRTLYSQHSVLPSPAIEHPPDRISGYESGSSTRYGSRGGTYDDSGAYFGDEGSIREAGERESLLHKGRLLESKRGYGTANDLEGQTIRRRGPSQGRHGMVSRMRSSGANWLRLTHLKKKRLNRHVVWQKCVVEPVVALPAVFLGLLLNILDALSYGMILFPLGEEIFQDTGADGIAMFYVSCIVSQLVFSLGGTIFKGGVGSEMIEVVPFFHKMAYMIMGSVGRDHPKIVLATTITSYALSSVLTGLVFLALGCFRLGNLVSFFPRSILTGCIGGVGVFLFNTGIEVSARLDGNLEFTVPVLKKLTNSDTIALWLVPLALAIILLVIRHFISHPVVLPTYFVAITAIFYFFVLVIPSITLEKLRQSGWIFEKPELGVPFYNFYTYYEFSMIDWSGLVKTVPTMFALTFFGILHVPINVPALGVAVQEDDVRINRELIAHGISNALSGFAGSIQNYLVYANSVLFIRNGGNTRIAGLLLAAGTFGVLVAGPGIIGYIPVMIVGTLIYMLGIELVKEALWDTFGRIQRLEYLTIMAIVLIMGVYDFVVGIVAGIFLACLNYVVQTSRKSAIRAQYTGSFAASTVRRHPIQRRFLRQVGPQTYVTKLAGYLFFGTIVAVENKIRHLIEEDTFKRQPIRFLIVDFSHVTGLDFSAAEAFTRMNRILRRRDIEIILSSVQLSGEIGKSLTMVGLLDSDSESDGPAPEVFEDLNRALESCENKLLIAFKESSDRLAQKKHYESEPMAVPGLKSPPMPFEAIHGSPRRGMLQRAATNTLEDQINTYFSPKWQNFKQPLPLILQTFQDLTDQNEDFWYRAVLFFEKREYPAGATLYSRGDEPDGFYLLQEGILRAEYDLDQGYYNESIVAGTTCGELPFFSETDRTGTVVAEKDCIAWLLTREKWKELESKQPDVARELLKIGLKLTSERMSAITSYVLLTAA